MKRTTLVGATDGAASFEGRVDGRHGALKVFFSYAPCSGTTAAMLDEAEGLMASGRDVFVADGVRAQAGKGKPFDLDQVLMRRPDVVVLENLALPNPPGARNRTRYQDAEELLRAGVDVYATLRVTDLQNERDRACALGADVPPEPVPDYMLYGAAQLEFVDIDPAELTSRAKTAGREVPDRVLNELRVMALRCVSAYASSAGPARPELADVQDAQVPFTRKRLVAFVEEGSAPGPVLLEAFRLVGAARSDLEVVCVRRPCRPSSARAQREEAAFQQLEAQVVAMGLSLKAFYGDDPAELVRDYLRTSGASDLVVARRRTSSARRLLAPLQPPFEERAVEGLADVSVHVVAGEDARRALSATARRAHAATRMRPRDVLVAVAACLAAFALVKALQFAGFGDTSSYLVFLASFIAVAAFTRALAPSLLAVGLGCLMQDYFFIRSYYQLAIDHRASLMLFVVFVVVSLACVVAVVHVGRAANFADLRERRTQALFDLNRSLLYAHSAAEVVDIALGAVVNLFGRSAALFRRDPFGEAPLSSSGERRVAARAVEGDLEVGAFDRVTEHAIAHWVFSNGERAGSGTDTHGESYVLYLPLSSEEGIEGVLAVSDRRPLSPGDRSFLDLVADQVAFALERQSLAAKHRGDLHVMRATDVRGAFACEVVSSAAVASDTLHALSDALIGAPEDDRAYREALVRSVAEESAREKLMADRMRGVLELPIEPVCNVRAEVASAVAEVREGLSGRVVELEPGEPVPPIVADAALVRTAVRLVLEASTSYVGKYGTVRASVASYPDRVSIVVADDRPASMGPSRAAAFELSSVAGSVGEPVYDEARARSLRKALLDREAVSSDQQTALAALCRAMHLPEEVARSESDREGQLNRQRILRFDRLEYGLYMAALIVHAHGGTIKQRYRLGGGAVVTLTLPRS